MKVEKGLFYTDDHDWIKVEGNEVTIGVADYAQDHLGDIVYVELPEEGDDIDEGDFLIAIESVKAASDVDSPVTGTVTAVNEELDETPELLNEDPYGAWIVKLEVEDFDESNFMDDEAYQKVVDELED